MSIELPEHDSPSNVDNVSELSADEQSDEHDGFSSESMNHEKTGYMHSRFRGQRINGDRDIERRDSQNICDRLYYDAKKKARERANDIRERLDQENKVVPVKLKLATERSYTPMRSRPSYENVHENLYSQSKKKPIHEGGKKDETNDDKIVRKPLISQTQGKIVSGRLYQRSRKKQQEGRKMREEIEKKLAPRAPTPTKRIPLSKATGIYERGLSHKAHTQRKIEDIINAPRESTFPKMRTQSRTRSSSRARSQTPSRRASDRCATPSRKNHNRGLPQDNFVKNGDLPPRGKNELPPPAFRMKTREQSPDLRS